MSATSSALGRDDQLLVADTATLDELVESFVDAELVRGASAPVELAYAWHQNSGLAREGALSFVAAPQWLDVLDEDPRFTTVSPLELVAMERAALRDLAGIAAELGCLTASGEQRIDAAEREELVLLLSESQLDWRSALSVLLERGDNRRAGELVGSERPLDSAEQAFPFLYASRLEQASRAFGLDADGIAQEIVARLERPELRPLTTAEVTVEPESDAPSLGL